MIGPRSKRSRALITGLVGVVGVLVITGCGGSARQSTVGPAATAARPPSAAGPTAAERQEIWRALHSSGSACARRSTSSARRVQIRAAVTVLIGFYRKYPEQEFQLPKSGTESAHMLSVLLLARRALLPCARGAIAAIDRVIPGPVGRGLESRAAAGSAAR